MVTLVAGHSRAQLAAENLMNPSRFRNLRIGFSTSRRSTRNQDSGQRKEVLTKGVLQDKIFVSHRWRSEGTRENPLDDHGACGLLSLRKRMNTKPQEEIGG